MTIATSETLSTRQDEAARISNSLKGQISIEERGRLYGTIARLSRSAYTLGQFPEHPELTAPRETLKAKALTYYNKTINRANADFKEPFLQFTTFEADDALNSLFNSMGMLVLESREKITAEIFELVKFSYNVGQIEPVRTRKPVSILNDISTW